MASRYTPIACFYNWRSGLIDLWKWNLSFVVWSRYTQSTDVRNSLHVNSLQYQNYNINYCVTVNRATGRPVLSFRVCSDRDSQIVKYLQSAKAESTSATIWEIFETSCDVRLPLRVYRNLSSARRERIRTPSATTRRRHVDITTARYCIA